MQELITQLFVEEPRLIDRQGQHNQFQTLKVKFESQLEKSSFIYE